MDPEEVHGGLSVAARRMKALALLKRSDVRYTQSHALLLCLQHTFDDGTVLLYEKLGWHGELFHHYAEKKDSEAVLRTCRRYSEADPQLWVRALRYFVQQAPESLTAVARGAAAASFQLPAAPAWSSAEGTREASVEKQWRAQIGEVIGVIEQDELLSPTEMLERLATRGGRVPLSVAWECLERHLRTTEASSVELARESQRASEELGKMWTEIYEIDEGSRVFQMAQCSACGAWRCRRCTSSVCTASTKAVWASRTKIAPYAYLSTSA